MPDHHDDDYDRNDRGNDRGNDNYDDDYTAPEDVPKHLLKLVTYMAKGITYHPDEVVVGVVDGDYRPVIELGVNSEDLGHVIGRRGRTARAMRLLVNAAGTKADVRVALEILDDDDDRDDGYNEEDKGD